MSKLIANNISKNFVIEDYEIKVLKDISYWIPSYANDAYIDDVLTINTSTLVDQETKQLRFYDLRIDRKNGI